MTLAQQNTAGLFSSLYIVYEYFIKNGEFSFIGRELMFSELKWAQDFSDFFYFT